MSLTAPQISFAHLRPQDTEDASALAEFIADQHYPFHVRHRPTAEQVREGIASGAYGFAPEHYATDQAAETDHRGWWIYAGEVRLGVVVLEDLTDEAPLFDLRLADEHRGQG